MQWKHWYITLLFRVKTKEDLKEEQEELGQDVRSWEWEILGPMNKIFVIEMLSIMRTENICWIMATKKS